MQVTDSSVTKADDEFVRLRRLVQAIDGADQKMAERMLAWAVDRYLNSWMYLRPIEGRKVKHEPIADPAT